MKTCKECQVTKPLNDFSKASGGNYYRTECKSCSNAMTKERNNLRKTYGMPSARYALSNKGMETRIVYAEQCLAPAFCLAWQIWPAR